LVLARAVDSLQLAIGKENLYPFLIQPVIAAGTAEQLIPAKWVWDMSASMPKKWENLRLAKIKRVSGLNSTSGGYTGALRLIFTANVQSNISEVAIFSTEYEIDSDLSYQPVRLDVVDSTEEPNPINPGESETVAGFLVFRTLDLQDQANLDFFDAVAPPADKTDTNGDGYYDNPAVYELADTVAGGETVTGDFSTSSLSHGTGLLTDSASNPIPELDSDINSWIKSFNYPFDVNANLTSVDNITIPPGLFKEFDITVPAGDQPTGDTSGTFYPAWINRIERIGTGGTQIRLFFATYNVTDADAGGSPSTTAIEFATLDLISSYTENEIVEILPNDNLQLNSSTEAANFTQHFGRGHVVLSSVWDSTTSTIGDFFAAINAIVDSPPDTEYSISSTRLSSFGTSRVPKYAPTKGESDALKGSTSGLASPKYPDYDNRYVTEQDQGLGDQIDLEVISGITPNTSIDRYGYTGALAHKVVKLVVSADTLGDDPNTYTNEVLPRLRALLGRDPAFGDFWHNGTRLMFYNGDSWQG
tara:strand:+ start:445 stop:2037 length:1593 start_codon:yes stop_codon:yes gene_type:complete